MTTDTTSKRSWMRPIAIAFGTLFLLTALVAGAGFRYMEKFATSPMDKAGQERVFTIRSGESLTGISRRLEQEGLVGNITLFKLLVRYQGLSKKIQAGEYALSPAMPPRELLTILARGRVKLYRLTIPEGLNLEETATLVEGAGFGSRENFLQLARDGELTASQGIEADDLEGYLFPETYLFARNTSQKEIIRKMVQRFRAVYTPEWQERTRELGFTRHQIVTLASIIEKETGTASERPLISSVFHNRLKRRMRLESDPTVIYGIPNFNGNITRKDLRRTTPYNTYRIKGLPKGPIANPGKHSLEAALFPAKSDFIFFVSKKDTTHKFSTNIRDHNKAVRRYQLGK
ncbi:MAG: endolytic transglycosylase MltG [Desulfobacteraceae bacterium]|nr:endolytic transglycosylase MltG [Desulfobacteraceae bacterium]